jgi:hypothetical protein
VGSVQGKYEKWLGPLPNIKQKQNETLKHRKEGTGDWFLNGDTFTSWQDNPGSLWIWGQCEHLSSGIYCVNSSFKNSWYRKECAQVT